MSLSLNGPFCPTILPLFHGTERAAGIARQYDAQEARCGVNPREKIVAPTQSQSVSERRAMAKGRHELSRRSMCAPKPDGQNERHRSGL
jgi:hypothetical protein